MSDEKRGGVEHATLRAEGKKSEVTLRVAGETCTFRTDATGIELAQAVKSIALRRRAETAMRKRGLEA